MKYVCILESLGSEHFYAGISDDVRARLAKHNAGEVARAHFEIQTVAVEGLSRGQRREQAFAFEKCLKSGSGPAFAKRRL